MLAISRSPWFFIIFIFAALLFIAQVSNSANAQTRLKDAKSSVVLIERPRSGGLPVELGTGFFVSEDGHILTAAHVLLESDESDQQVAKHIISVRQYGKSRKVRARILALNRFTDVALLKIAADEPTPALALQFWERVEPGDQLKIIGHPIGRGEWYESATLVDSIQEQERILIQATLLQGQSGGPALNEDGAVVGIVSHREEGPRLSYLVPIADAAGMLSGVSLFADQLSGGAIVQKPGMARGLTQRSHQIAVAELEAEPNNDFSNANIINLIQSDKNPLLRLAGNLKGNMDDDYFKVVLSDQIEYPIKILLRPKERYNATIRAQVIDFSFETVKESTEYAPTDMKFIIDSNQHSFYFIKISSNVKSSIDYELFFSSVRDG